MANDGLSIGGGLMQALKTRMYYQQSRQKVLAENVANADSPGFRPTDLKPPSVDPNRAGVRVALTRHGHMQLDTANGGFDGPATFEMCSPIRGGGAMENLDDYARTYLRWRRDHLK